MSARNHIILIGTAGSAPELKFINQDKAVATFSIAVRKAHKVKSGEPDSEWFGVEIWGKQAEKASEWINKGNLVSVSGSLKLDRWEKDGVKHVKVIVIADDFFITTPKGGKDESDVPPF